MRPYADGDRASASVVEKLRLRVLQLGGADVPRALPAACNVHSICNAAPELFSGSGDVALLLYQPGNNDILDELRQALQRRPTARLVVLSPLTPDAARELAALAALEACTVVWECEGRTSLVDALAKAGQDGVFSPLHRLTTQTKHVPPIVAAIVRRICERETVVRSVRGLAESLGVPESTLRYHRRTVFPGSALRRLIDWALLLKALDGRGDGGRPRVASTLGAHPRTFQRLSQRLLAIPLSEALRRHDLVQDRFRRWSGAALSLGEGENESVFPSSARRLVR